MLVTKPPTNLLRLGYSSSLSEPALEPPSDPLEPAVARKGTPGSVLKASAGSANKLAGGGGIGDRRPSKGPGKSLRARFVDEAVVEDAGRAGDSVFHRGDGKKTVLLPEEDDISEKYDYNGRVWYPCHTCVCSTYNAGPGMPTIMAPRRANTPCKNHQICKTNTRET